MKVTGPRCRPHLPHLPWPDLSLTRRCAPAHRRPFA